MLVLENQGMICDEKMNYIALGSFDGLHLGHLSLIRKTQELSMNTDGNSIIFTFKNHPRMLIEPDKKIELLMNNDEKIEILDSLGVDITALRDFDSEMMQMMPEDFIKYLCENYSVRGIVVGFNFRFGYKNLGDIDLLRELSSKYNYELYIMEPCQYEGEVVSSTRIRESLDNGAVDKASEMLTRPYSIVGEVVHGKKLGRTIGFPTANIKVPQNKIIPKKGVYYTNVLINGKYFKGITSVGNNPTVNGQELTIETYVLDFEGSLYEKEIKLLFIDRIRDEVKFNSLDELVTQIQNDKKYAINKELYYK